MKLKTVRVSKFKCVHDSTEFRIDQKVTCLVGKNESGKTAILQALEKLNPLKEELGRFDFDLEYPRDAWDVGLQERKETALITTWTFDPPDIEALETVLGPGAVSVEKPVAVSKGYFDGRRWDLEVDEARVVNNLIHKNDLRAEVRERLSEAKSVKELAERLKDTKDRPAGEEAFLKSLTANFPQTSAFDTAIRILEERLPKIVYVPEYFRMAGQISLEDLKQKLAAKTLTEGHTVFMALLDMVGASVKELEEKSKFEPLIARLESASNRIGREIFHYWSQNRHLRVQVRIDQGRGGDPAPFNSGWVVRTRVENTRHNVTVGFDDRSAGFVWFFSFLVWFSQAKKNYGQNLIILLDEPALSLHAKAQRDLLRYIEERLAPTYQVIYTTHSPFMVDPTNLLRARTVEDVYREPGKGEPPIPPDELGTKVGDRVFSTDRDTVFPLQAALGYEITQTLFVGEHSLLVEGPAEILYLSWFSRRLAAAKRQGLDPRWVMCPSGGIDKIPAFMSLFGGNRLDLAILTDLAHGGKRKVRDLRESRLLKDGRVFTADTYAGQEEADIEDIIGREMFRDLVGQAYALDEGQLIPRTRPEEAPHRVVKETEEKFGLLPPGVPPFNHYRPAEFLIQLGLDRQIPGLAGALDRFERLFADLNALLAQP